MVRRFVLVLCALALVAGCDSVGSLDFQEEVVVSALLIAGQPLPNLDLARTGPIGEPYDPVERSIGDAEVTIRLLREDGSVEAEMPYEHLGEGRYRPFDGDREIVLAARTYTFEAVVPGFDTVAAETFVPGAFEVARPPADTVVYQQGDGPSVDVTRSAYPGRQAAYLFSVRSLDPTFENLTPFARDLVLERDVDLEDLVQGSSPILNEGNYTVNSDGTIAISIPWFAVNYYGPNQFTATALDDALLEFLQSQTIQFVPTTLSPGEIPNVVTNVRNGQGVFGSIAQVLTETFVAPL